MSDANTIVQNNTKSLDQHLLSAKQQDKLGKMDLMAFAFSADMKKLQEIITLAWLTETADTRMKRANKNHPDVLRDHLQEAYVVGCNGK